MPTQSFAGPLIMMIVCFCCAALFLGIGICAARKVKPMHFWADSHIDPETVHDIPEYNRKNALMWKRYSVPYWLAGIFGLLGMCREWCTYVSLALLILACFPGLAILIRCYRRIENQHIKKTS